MNLTRTATVSLFLLSLPLVGFISREDTVAFGPEEGTTVTKSLSLEASFYLDDLSVIFNGQEMPAEQIGSFDEALVIQAAVDVTDEYVSSRPGKVLELVRTYDDLSLEAGTESDAKDVDDFGELSGSSVDFKWDSEADEYVKSFHESEGNEDLLENLEVDMDFMSLLPDGEVSEGDTWEATGDELGRIFFPGGIPAVPSAGEDNASAEEMTELFKEEMEGQLKEALGDFTVNCTYKGTHDESGTQVGVIEFKFEGEADIDLSELILAAINLQAADTGIEADITATLGFEFDGEGTLLWSTSAGHVFGFDMESETVLTLDLDGEVDAMGQVQSVEIAVEASGESTWALETGSDSEDK